MPSTSDIVEKFRAKYKNVNDVKSAFKRFDRNGDGALEKQELAAALKSSGESYSDVEVNAIFSLEEFIALMSPSASSVVKRISKGFKNLNDVKAAFKKIDTDNDGLLSKKEMMASSGNKYDAEEVDAIFALGDVNGDGQIDMGEFISIMFPSAVDVALQVSQTFKTLDDVKQAFKLLDKDGLDDLIVGAPQYYDRENNQGGAVYVYMNNGSGYFSDKYTQKLTGQIDSEFGGSLIPCGDLDGDGFVEIAIGAPQAEGGKGIVELYSASPSGLLLEEPTQTLRIPDVRGFGYSLGGDQDVDGNGYPDLVVGSLSDKAVLFRSRPVVKVNSVITSTKNVLSFPGSEP